MGKQAKGRWSGLIGEVEALEGMRYPRLSRRRYGAPAGNRAPSDPVPCRAELAIQSSAKVLAYDLINRENGTIGERKLFALVDAVACVLAHEGREETARLALESVVGSTVALAAVRTLRRGRDVVGLACDQAQGAWMHNRVLSAAKDRTFHLLDQAVSTGEQRLAAVIDGAACLIEHGGRAESARLLFEMVDPELAVRCVRILTGEETASWPPDNDGAGNPS